MDILPLKMAATVRYLEGNHPPASSHLPCRGSAAVIMFLASNICWVSSGTVQARYWAFPLVAAMVRVAGPGLTWPPGGRTQA